MHSSSDSFPAAYSSCRIWGVYLVLLVLAVPWYWQVLPPQAALVVVLGLPLWVVTTIAVCFVLAAYTAALLSVAWPEESEEEDQP